MRSRSALRIRYGEHTHFQLDPHDVDTFSAVPTHFAHFLSQGSRGPAHGGRLLMISCRLALSATTYVLCPVSDVAVSYPFLSLRSPQEPRAHQYHRCGCSTRNMAQHGALSSCDEALEQQGGPATCWLKQQPPILQVCLSNFFLFSGWSVVRIDRIARKMCRKGDASYT